MFLVGVETREIPIAGRCAIPLPQCFPPKYADVEFLTNIPLNLSRNFQSPFQTCSSRYEDTASRKHHHLFVTVSICSKIPWVIADSQHVLKFVLATIGKETLTPPNICRCV